MEERSWLQTKEQTYTPLGLLFLKLFLSHPGQELTSSPCINAGDSHSHEWVLRGLAKSSFHPTRSYITSTPKGGTAGFSFRDPRGTLPFGEKRGRMSTPISPCLKAGVFLHERDNRRSGCYQSAWTLYFERRR